MKTIEIESIENQTSRKIIELLKERESALFGEIARELSISVNRAQEAVHSLVEQGIIAYSRRPKRVTLIVDVK